MESVRISTTDEPKFKKLDITAEAQVETVIRSASGLEPGDAIRISYVHLDHKPLAGPSEPDVLQKNRSYPAFLTKAEKDEVYATAVRGCSVGRRTKAPFR